MAPGSAQIFEQPAWSYKSPATNTSYISFDLPKRLYQAAVYPVASEDGHRIFVSANQEGLQVTWHGGRPKHIPEPPQLKPRPKPKAVKNGEAMEIDNETDKDKEKNKPQVNPADPFEIQTDSSPTPVVASLSIALPSAARDLSFPNLPRHIIDHGTRSIPLLFSTRAVVAVLTADGAVRILALPLLPNTHIQHADLRTQLEHNNVQSYLVEGLGHTSKGKLVGLRSTILSRRGTGGDGLEWDFILASWTHYPLATLSITQIPMSSAGELFASLEKTSADQTHTTSVPHPIVSLAFNPAKASSKRSRSLVVSDKGSNVRIATLSSPSDANRTTSLDWIGSLQLPFQTGGLPKIQGPSQRCQTLDLRWVLGGKAIVTLLDDGQWGVWDIEGAGPLHPEDTGRASLSSIAGGSTAPFTLHGFLNQTPEVTSTFSTQLSLRSKTRPSAQDGRQLAPMTPNTRKVKEHRLFKTEERHQPKQAVRSTSASGGISVLELEGSDSRTPHESIAFWYGSSLYMIPDLIQHWQRATGAGSLSTAASRNIHAGDITSVPLLSAGLGGVIKSISHLPIERTSILSPPPSTSDLIIALEHRLTIINHDAKSESVDEDKPSLFQDSPSKGNSIVLRQGPGDQDMLRRGELDLGGMNRLLDGMDTDFVIPETGSLAPRASRRVGFAS